VRARRVLQRYCLVHSRAQLRRPFDQLVFLRLASLTYTNGELDAFGADSLTHQPAHFVWPAHGEIRDPQA
jgi:hypothetical protein